MNHIYLSPFCCTAITKSNRMTLAAGPWWVAEVGRPRERSRVGRCEMKEVATRELVKKKEKKKHRDTVWIWKLERWHVCWTETWINALGICSDNWKLSQEQTRKQGHYTVLGKVMTKTMFCLSIAGCLRQTLQRRKTNQHLCVVALSLPLPLQLLVFLTPPHSRCVSLQCWTLRLTLPAVINHPDRHGKAGAASFPVPEKR